MTAGATIPAAKPWGRRWAPGPEERRARIVAAAEESFLAAGYAATSTGDIAARAGMSKRTLYAVFPSKAALFEAVVRAVLADGTPDGVPDGPDPARALGDYLFAVSKAILSDRRTGLLRLVIAESPREPALAEAFSRAVLGGGASAVAAWLARREADGTVAVPDREEAATMLLGMAVGHPHIRRLAGGERIADAQLRDRAHRAAGMFLRGVAPP